MTSIKETVERLHETRFFYANERRRVSADQTPTSYELGQNECAEIAKQLKDAAALIERLAGALEPFANAGSMEIKGNGMVNVLLFIEDVERARSALSGEPTP